MSKTKRLTLLDLVSAQFPNVKREQVRAAILFGDVEVSGERCRDPKRIFSGQPPVSIDVAVFKKLESNSIPLKPYVSRGGEKLDRVLEDWAIPVSGRVWLDAGCSTGGFTHALLLRGARLVHAIDVGYNVLDWRLRQLSAVEVHERCNIMGLETLDPQPDAAVADLSFRSIEGPAEKILSLCKDKELYALIKPQFERKYAVNAGKHEGHNAHRRKKPEGVSEENFQGVVKMPEERRSILFDLCERLAARGILIDKIAEAGIKGRGGNQEYIAHLVFSDLSESEILARGQAQLSRLF